MCSLALRPKYDSYTVQLNDKLQSYTYLKKVIWWCASNIKEYIYIYEYI